MIYVGNEKIRSCYLGNQFIKKAYLGDDLLFKAPERYQISAVVSPDGSGTVSGAGRYADGDTAILTATPASGNMFVGWEASIEEGVSGVLPDGYRELEYIQSDNACGIDTGYGVNFSKTRVVIDIEMGNYTSGNEYIFRSDVSSSKYFYLYRKASGSVIFRANTFSAQTITVNNPNSRMTLDFDGPNGTFVVGDTEKTYTSTQLPDTTMSTSFHLFSSVTTNTTTKSVSAKLYSARIYTDDKLDMDFVPCKNPDGVIGLFDLVNGGFYENAWGGTFTAGPEKNRVFVNESSLSFTPTSNVSFLAKFKQVLPDGYTLLEYISNPNKTYITAICGAISYLINPTYKTRYELTIRRKGTETGIIFGRRSQYTNTSGSTNIIRQQSLRLSDTAIINAAGGSVETDTMDIMHIVLDCPSSTITVNDLPPVKASAGNNLYKAAAPSLFALGFTKYGGSTGTSFIDPADFYFYHFAVFSSGVLKHNWYPCISPDGVVGIYDTVNDVFRTGASTTKLLEAGPKV